MKRVRILLTVVLVALSVIGGARAEEPEAFRELMRQYEQIRLALVGDAQVDVKENALAIAARANELLGDFDASSAGVPEAEADAGEALLGEIVTAASKVAAAQGLEAVREAFFDLSKPMGRYRKLTGDKSTIVAYCPMAKKAWLQPEGELGNPYLGTEMPTCGNRIPD